MAGDLHTTGTPPPVEGRSRIRPGAVVIALVTLGAAGLFCYLGVVYPLHQIGPKQPIPFSHRIHAGVKAINCRFCHPFVERSTHAGIPEVGKCLFCHNFIITRHPEIVKEHEYYNTGTPVPWKRLFVAKDFVFFRHQPHLLRGFDCSECHGYVQAMDRLPQHTFQMGFCIQCHRANDANISCWLACHN